MIKRKNKFTAFTIDQVYHRENQDILADSYKPLVTGAAREYEGLDPVVISRVVVGKRKRDDSDQEFGAESEYSSDHSYEFHVGPIDYSKRPVQKTPKHVIQKVIKI